jgi:O-antigen/teichoic acid export membrane protein
LKLFKKIDSIDYQISKKESAGFLRSISILVSGTVVAHGITALAMPVLSRLYSPADFSALAVFSGLLSVISVAACLRFDIAITLPDNDTDAVNILALALNSAVIVSVLLAIPSLLMTQKVSLLLNQPNLEPYLWLLPIGVLLAASYSAFQNWFVRKKQFRVIATSRVCQSFAALGTQVGLGVAGIAPLGLLIGYIMNSGAACIVLVYNFLKAENKLVNTISVPRMRAMAATHHRFPKYSTFEAFSNSAAIQVPIIIIAAVAVGPEAGYLMMAMYVLQAPVALIGTAIAQVYLSRAPDEHRAGQLGKFTAEIFGKLLKAGAGPLLFAGIVSPVAFPIVLGEEWRRAGELVVWMTPWFIMQFIAYPISMGLHVTGKQRVALILQLFALIARVSVVWVFGSVAANKIAEAYAISGFVIYSVYAATVLHAVSIQKTEITRCSLQSLPYLFAWGVLGYITRLGIDTITRLYKHV